MKITERQEAPLDYYAAYGIFLAVLWSPTMTITVAVPPPGVARLPHPPPGACLLAADSPAARDTTAYMLAVTRRDGEVEGV